MRMIEIIACKAFLVAVVAYITLLGIMAMDWKPLAFACVAVIFYFYRDKITLIAFKDIRVELAQKVERAEEILSVINSTSYNLSCVNLQQLAGLQYNGAIPDTGLFRSITQIDELQKHLEQDKEKQAFYRRLRNQALLNCVIFVIENARGPITQFRINDAKHEKLSELWKTIADSQSQIAIGKSVKKAFLLSTIAKYQEYLSDTEICYAEYYISQMEVD